ncbi:hypothetical protein HGRIS_000437 [Hohenbuehelia grisea]|uniref:Laccase n=1 Tax=Hohenbuehelia grisea TaxID=104357 RepID=A0ABR3JSE0_9AGAR
MMSAHAMPAQPGVVYRGHSARPWQYCRHFSPTFMLANLLILSTLWASAYGATQSYTLKLENAVVAPDGIPRKGIVVNGKSPGPLITARRNDNLEILVINNLTDDSMPRSTSIHWHGLFMQHSAAQDGVAWVTQCPIGYGDSFKYRFNVGNQTGTHWYHSHVTTQYCDGLRGPLVIYDDNDHHRHLYDVDDESTVLTVNEWYHDNSIETFQFGRPPNAMVLNGLGRMFFSRSPLTVIDAARGSRYRFRVINAGCTASFEFSVDGHPLTVIEIDGISVHAHPTDSIVLHAGQRASVVLNANQTVRNYWIRTRAAFEGTQLNYDDEVAILRYRGAKVLRPYTEKTVKKVLHSEEGLIPYGVPSEPAAEPDVKLDLNITTHEDSYLINGRSFESPSMPVLLQLLNGADPLATMPNNSIVYLPRNKLIEISIPGGALLGPHPFHLHGHTFQVVRSINSTKYNYVNPPIRDVVDTGNTGDNVTIRFRTDNPGPWFFHCHVEFHLEGGLAILFVEEPDDIRKQEYSQEWRDLCPRWKNIKTGKRYSKSAYPGRERTRFNFTPGSAPPDE